MGGMVKKSEIEAKIVCSSTCHLTSYTLLRVQKSKAKASTFAALAVLSGDMGIHNNICMSVNW